MNALLTLDSSIDSLIVLAAGIAAAWLLAMLACRLVTSAAWQRAIWQTALLASGLLLVCEASGLGRALNQAGFLSAEPVRRQVPSEPTVADATNKSDPSTEYSVLSTEGDNPEEVLSDASVNQTELSTSHTQTVVPSTEYSVPSTQIESVPMFAPAAISAFSEALIVFAPLLWLIGTMVLIARLLLGQFILTRFAQGRRKEANVSRIDRLAHRLGLRRPIRIVRLPKLTGPVAFGLWRPTIGLPAGFEQDFSPAEQEAMLAHELAHLANHDPAWRLTADLLAAVLWWHPGVWLIRARFIGACEVAADEACLLVDDGPELLAGCLLSLAKRLSPAVAPGWLAIEGSGFRSSLGQRVARLLALPAAIRRPGAASLTLVCLMGSAAVVAVALISTAWARPQAALTGETSMKNILASSWRQSLAGGLLAVVLTSGSPAVADDEPRREGDRPPAARREDGRENRPEARRDGERRDGDRPDARRDGDRPDARRDGDRPAPRDGERRRDADRGPGDRREGDRPGQPPRRDGDRPDAPRPREGRPDNPQPPRDPEGMRARLTEERGKIEEQLAKMRQAHGEHARAGHGEEVEKLERAMKELSRHLEEVRDALARSEGPDGRRPAAPGRRAEGQPDNRRAEAGRRPEGLSEGRRPDGPRPEGPGPGRPGGPPNEDLINVLRDLRAEVQNLRQEVNDLRARVQQIGPRGDGPRGEGPRDAGPRGEGGRRPEPRGEGPRGEQPRGR